MFWTNHANIEDTDFRIENQRIALESVQWCHLAFEPNQAYSGMIDSALYCPLRGYHWDGTQRQRQTQIKKTSQVFDTVFKRLPNQKQCNEYMYDDDTINANARLIIMQK